MEKRFKLGILSQSRADIFLNHAVRTQNIQKQGLQPHEKSREKRIGTA